MCCKCWSSKLFLSFNFVTNDENNLIFEGDPKARLFCYYTFFKFKYTPL